MTLASAAALPWMVAERSALARRLGRGVKPSSACAMLGLWFDLGGVEAVIGDQPNGSVRRARRAD